MKVARIILSVLGVAALTFSLPAQPQSADVLLRINGNPITVEEFNGLYLKNSIAAGTKISKSTLDEYLNLFINFKLKVQAARDAGIDTLKSFQAEYRGYIDQLAQSYLIDQESLNRLISEAYQRMTLEISASHILISTPESLLPADTLKYYQKAMEARKRVLSGEAFGKVALSMSNDPSVSRNNGYLGWFSAFQMVYPFESAAYQTPVDSISLPVRTRFGYHIIKVHGKRPTKGQIKVAHIMIRVQPNASPQEMEEARKKIVALHTRLMNGEDFASMAKAESQDNGTAPNGGELPWIRSGQIIPEFEQVAFSLERIGEISQPFQTTFGWHIAKLIDRKLPGTFDEMHADIKNLIGRDSRNQYVLEAFLKKLKAQYGVKENPADAQKYLTPLLDSSVYKGNWKQPIPKNNPVLFKIKDNEYKLTDLLRFVANNQQKANQQALAAFSHSIYLNWINQSVIDFEKSQLPQKYPEFKQLANEYLEGMLLFDISNRELWSKAMDSTAIRNYFENHRENYLWGPRVHFTVYNVSNEKTAKKILKDLQKTKNNTPEKLLKKYNKKETVLAYQQFVSDAEDNRISGFKSWKNGFKFEKNEKGEVTITQINKQTNNERKEITDCLAEVSSDYQNHLEQLWLAELKNRYPVEVNQDVYQKLLEQITQ